MNQLRNTETALCKSNQERYNYELKSQNLATMMSDQCTSHQESMDKAQSSHQESMDKVINSQQEAIDKSSHIYTKAYKEQIDILREEKNQQIESLQQDKKYLTDQLDLKKELSELTKKKESSFALGVEGENALLKLLCDDGSFKVDDSHTKNHKGDALIGLNNKTYCIDSKKHKTVVPLDEVTKLVEDIHLNDFDGGAIVAWDAYISDPTTNARIKDNFVIKIMSGKPILFISYASRFPGSAIIALLKMLEQNIPSEEEKNHGVNNDKLRKMILADIEKQEKQLDSVLNIQKRTHKKRKRELKTLKDSMNLLITVEDDNEDISDDNSQVDEEVPTIEGLLSLCATNYEDDNGQRNSTRDIKKYLINYCENHSHNLLDDVKCINNPLLNDILSNLGYELGKKSGKNYENKRKDARNETWPVNLSPDLLN